MTPTIHDAVGAPIPGVSGVQQPKAASAPTAARFESLLRQLMSHGGGHIPATKPGAVIPRGSVPRPASGMQPGFHPRGIMPQSAVKGATHARGVVARQGAAHAARATPAERQALAAAIRHASAKAGVEPGLSVAIARAESNLNPAARSADGRSVGTFQVTHSTKQELHRKIASGTMERPPGSDDVALGVGYLRYLHDLFGREAQLAPRLSTVAVTNPAEREHFAVAAFNAGEGRVAEAQARAVKAGGDPTHFADIQRYLPPITQGYVERVAGYAREERAALAHVEQPNLTAV